MRRFRGGEGGGRDCIGPERRVCVVWVLRACFILIFTCFLTYSSHQDHPSHAFGPPTAYFAPPPRLYPQPPLVTPQLTFGPPFWTHHTHLHPLSTPSTAFRPTRAPSRPTKTRFRAPATRLDPATPDTEPRTHVASHHHASRPTNTS